MLGPRIGKYAKDGTPEPLPGHHIPMAMLGTFILLFGWFGFNAASTFAATDVRFAVVAANTALAGCVRRRRRRCSGDVHGGKKPDPGMMVNGMLAGLVAITAPCAFVAALGGGGHRHHRRRPRRSSPCSFFEKRGVDDPVGAITVHGVCGIFGVLASASSPTAATAPAGTAPMHRRTASGVA